MRACAECARQGGETPSLQGPGIGGAQSRASAQKRFDQLNENDYQFNETDEQTKESENDQVISTEVNVEDNSNSNIDERKLPATSTGRKRWKPNKLNL